MSEGEKKRSSYERNTRIEKDKLQELSQMHQKLRCKVHKIHSGTGAYRGRRMHTVRALFCRLSAGCESHRKRYGKSQDLADAVHTKLFILPDETVVLPGHMGQTSIGFEKGNNPFV